MTVTLDIRSNDVQHSWWIPELGGKMDALPGYTNKTWFKVTEPGVYKGQCAELCGRNHANMYARVIALPFDEWQAWYDRRGEDDQGRRRGGRRQRGPRAGRAPGGRRWPRRESETSVDYAARWLARRAPPADHHPRGAARAARLDVVDHHDRPQEDRDPLPLDRRRVLRARRRRGAADPAAARRAGEHAAVAGEATTSSSPCTGRRWSSSSSCRCGRASRTTCCR